MRTHVQAIVWVAAFIVFVGHATAQVSGIYVEYYSEQNPLDGWAAVSGYPARHSNEPGLPSGSDVTISNAGTVPYRVFATSPTTTDIGNITISASSGTQPVFLTVGRFTDSTTKPTPTRRLDVAGGRDIGRIRAPLGRAEIQARALQDLADWIQAWRVVRLDADGTLLGDVDHNDGADQAPVLAVIDVYDIATGVSIVSYGGAIGSIATTGDCGGAIATMSGSIDSLSIGGGLFAPVDAGGAILSIAVSGDIGVSTSPVSITASGDIRSVVASAIYADIDASDPGGGGTWDVWRLETTGGIFSGSLSLDRLRDPVVGSEEGVIVDTDLDADITIARSALEPIVVEGDFPVGRVIDIGINLQNNTINNQQQNTGKVSITGNLAGTLWIGRSLLGPISVASSGGLQGQIVINARDDGGVWMTGDDGTLGNGSVTVDGVSLALIPWYDQTSASLGGGAAGVVPFSVHFKDCSPASNTLRDDECENYYNALRRVGPGSAWPSVSLHHYGSITAVGEGKPFTVRRKPASDTSCDWQDVTASFSHTMHPSGATRAILISGPFVAPYDYLIEPRTTGESLLACDGLPASTGDVPVHDYDYRLRVLQIEDINLGGFMDQGDVTAWLADPEDVNFDDVVDGADLIAVLEALAAE